MKIVCCMHSKTEKITIFADSRQHTKNNMKTLFKNSSVPTYMSPDCEVCETLTNDIICQSGSIEDWVYDENDF